MPKQSRALSAMPPIVLSHLRQLGENLTIARKRRKEPRKVWAERIGVTEPTLMRMEKGDPSVSFGTYATALWLIGRSQAIPELAAPELDRGALETEVRAAAQRSVRQGPSIDKKLRAKATDKAQS
jgi:DNA-binding XRE family transcriptional regulator